MTGKHCATASDTTPNGIIDLSDKIIVGDPVRSPKQPNMWRVPYNVVDSIGNRADTVWRDVVVEEMSFEEYEVTLRKDFDEEKRRAVEEAVAKATRKEKGDCEEKVRRLEEGERVKGGGRNSNKCAKCPPPPKCPDFDGKDDNGLRKELRACQSDLGDVKRSLTDRTNESGGGGRGGGGGDKTLASTLEEIFPLFVILMLGSSTLGLLVLVLQRAKSVLMGTSGVVRGKGDDERASNLAKSVTYHSPRHGTGSVSVNGSTAGTVQPQTPQSARSGVFSPGSVGSAKSMQSPASYNLSPITPSRMSKR